MAAIAAKFINVERDVCVFDRVSTNNSMQTGLQCGPRDERESISQSTAEISSVLALETGNSGVLCDENTFLARKWIHLPKRWAHARA